MTTAPVMKLDAGEARKTMMRAISPGDAMRPSGCDAPMSPRAARRSGTPARAVVDELGVDRAGGDGVDAHAVRGVLDGELPRDLGDRALGRAVGALRGQPDDARDRRDVDDRPAAALDQVRQRLAAVHEDTAHVGGHQPVPLVVRRLDDRLEQEPARVVDHDVEARRSAQREVDRARAVSASAASPREGRDAVVREFLDGRVDVLGHDLRARGAQLARRPREPMPPAAPVTMRHGAVEVSRRCPALPARRYRMIVIQSGRRTPPVSGRRRRG